MKTTDYLGAYKVARGITSDYRLAKVLGVSQSTVSHWRSGYRQPDNLMCFRIAEGIGTDPAIVVAHIERERAERVGDHAAASGWGELLERLGGVAAAVILSLGLVPEGHAQDDNSRPPPGVSGEGLRVSAPSLYIMSTDTLKAAWRAIRRAMWPPAASAAAIGA